MVNMTYETMLFNAIKNGQTELRSVYDIWLALGNVGTAQDFIDTLKGESAYQIWQQQPGNEGKTVDEFLAAIGGLTKSDMDAEVTARKNGDADTLKSAKAYTDSEISKGDRVKFSVQGTTLVITPVS